MCLRKHKGKKTDYSLKTRKLQKQLAMDEDEAEKFQVYKLYSFRWSEAYYMACGSQEPSILNERVTIPWPHWIRLSSNFGVTLVVSSKEKLVTTRNVLAAGPQPQPMLVTVIVTLMHMAIYSEEVDLDVYVVHFHLFIYLEHCFM